MAWTEQSTSRNLALASAEQTTPTSTAACGSSQSVIHFTSDLRVQHVQVTINAPQSLEAYTKLTLISPDGTSSVLLDRPGFVDGSDQTSGLTLDDITVTSNAFWGESSAGDWTLQAEDFSGQVTDISGWTMEVWGDSEAAAPLVYTPEFALLVSGGLEASASGSSQSAAECSSRNIVRPAPNMNAIDLIALPDPTFIDLNGGAGMIDGVPVTVIAGLTNASANGSSGGTTIIGSAGNNVIRGGDAAPGNQDLLVGGGGDDTITGGSGSTVVETGLGASLVDLTLAETGDVDNVVLGGADTLLGGLSFYQPNTPHISLPTALSVSIEGSSESTVFQNDTTLTIYNGSGTSTIVGGQYSGLGDHGETVFAGNGGVVDFAGSSPVMFIGGSGASTLVGSGAQTIFGGAGGGQFWLSNENSIFVGSTGAATVVGSRGSVIWGGPVTDIIATGGSETLAGALSATDKAQIWAGSGNDLIVTGSGTADIIAGSGDLTACLQGGDNTFLFANGQAGGVANIQGFQPGKDHIVLWDYGQNVELAALSTQTSDGAGGTVMSLSDGTKINFIDLRELTWGIFSSP
jgi:subtilisin-like proprotein convertase family protein